VYLLPSLVRECRGGEAIGRDAREKQISKFDLAWKLELIRAVVQAGHREESNHPPDASTGSVGASEDTQCGDSGGGGSEANTAAAPGVAAANMHVQAYAFV